VYWHEVQYGKYSVDIDHFCFINVKATVFINFCWGST